DQPVERHGVQCLGEDVGHEDRSDPALAPRAEVEERGSALASRRAVPVGAASGSRRHTGSARDTSIDRTIGGAQARAARPLAVGAFQTGGSATRTAARTALLIARRIAVAGESVVIAPVAGEIAVARVVLWAFDVGAAALGEPLTAADDGATLDAQD